MYLELASVFYTESGQKQTQNLYFKTNYFNVSWPSAYKIVVRMIFKNEETHFHPLNQ